MIDRGSIAVLRLLLVYKSLFTQREMLKFDDSGRYTSQLRLFFALIFLTAAISICPSTDEDLVTQSCLTGFMTALGANYNT